jgi:hypothetical protein
MFFRGDFDIIETYIKGGIMGFSLEAKLGAGHQAIVDNAATYIDDQKRSDLKDPAKEAELVKFITIGGNTTEAMAKELVAHVRAKL